MLLFKGKEKVADARRKELAKETRSDHLTVVNAFEVKKKKRFHGEMSLMEQKHSFNLLKSLLLGISGWECLHLG